ncbi:hypothetical protein M422DRAFT_268933 [Sphaerobolus stellatus SS14]|uniref:Ig-like domain-containing protein n=1 Tax=Sphaerobolus stellatus (strain SS14) TaxID=990650 RepID=A0A0C9UWQ1_SPHS4|nr:hypothetical protein M422DRAFT_268933 [Sphaerobolus stellatus SS14]
MEDEIVRVIEAMDGWKGMLVTTGGQALLENPDMLHSAKLSGMETPASHPTTALMFASLHWGHSRLEHLTTTISFVLQWFQRLGDDPRKILRHVISQYNVLSMREGAPVGDRGVLIQLDIAFRATEESPRVIVNHDICAHFFQLITVLSSGHPLQPVPPHNYLDKLESFLYLLSYIFFWYRPDGTVALREEVGPRIVRSLAEEVPIDAQMAKSVYFAVGMTATHAQLDAGKGGPVHVASGKAPEGGWELRLDPLLRKRSEHYVRYWKSSTRPSSLSGLYRHDRPSSRRGSEHREWQLESVPGELPTATDYLTRCSYSCCFRHLSQWLPSSHLLNQNPEGANLAVSLWCALSTVLTSVTPSLHLERLSDNREHQDSPHPKSQQARRDISMTQGDSHLVQEQALIIFTSLSAKSSANYLC